MTRNKDYGRMEMPQPVRPGISDCWNAFMAVDADFSTNPFEIPYCPTTAEGLPSDIISWAEALGSYAEAVRNGDKEFHSDSFVCFFMDDHYFDKGNGIHKLDIWDEPKRALEILRHFAGVITPDYSACQDFPIALKIYQVYRTRLFGYWFGKNGVPTINSVRWGTSETYGFMYAGLPSDSVLCIGTSGGSPRRLADRKRFENGLNELISRLHPHTILTYGSAEYPCFDQIRKLGISVKSYKSHTARFFERRGERRE